MPDGYGTGRGEADAERADMADLHAITPERWMADEWATCPRHGRHRSVPGVGCVQCDALAAHHSIADRQNWRPK